MTVADELPTPEALPAQPAIPPLRRDLKRAPRLVVVETLSHQRPGEQPSQAVLRSCRDLYDDEQPFLRSPFKVGAVWRPLELGWFAETGRVSLLSLENVSADTDACVELAVWLEQPPDPRRTMHSPPRPAPQAVPFALLPAGQSLRFQPADVRLLRVRCVHGEARCTLRLYPE